MNKFIVSSLAMAVALVCSSTISLAEEISALPKKNIDTKSINHNARQLKQSTDWRGALLSQIKQHPAIVAQRQAMESEYSLSNALRQALYNPELATSVESEGDYTNYNVGINQTFDWWDKSSVRAKAADFQVKAALQSYRAALQETLAQSLVALVQYNSAEKRSELALSQEQGINILIKQVQERQAVGELGPIDSQLALYSLGKKFSETAKIIAEFEQVKMTAEQLLPSLANKEMQIPMAFWSSVPVDIALDSVNSHPAILASHAQWQIAKQNSRMAALDAKAEPTVGLSAGKSGGESTIGLSLSVPLNIRNDYSNEVKAANQSALAVESALIARLQAQKYQLKAALNTVKQYQKRNESWQELMVDEQKNADQLVAKLWRSGEINTNDYLMSLQQISDGKMAGIDMQEAYQLALIDALTQSGQLIDFISPSVTH
jgi:outer membrane protein TolC